MPSTIYDTLVAFVWTPTLGDVGERAGSSSVQTLRTEGIRDRIQFLRAKGAKIAKSMILTVEGEVDPITLQAAVSLLMIEPC